MSNGEHIRLGDLELYALGALPPGEAEPLQVHVGGCAHCAMKLAEARGSAAVLAFVVPQERPAGTIKAELMARIRANRETEERYAWPLNAKPMEPRTRAPKKDKAGRTSDWLNWVLVPAAIALALLSLALSWLNRKLAAQLQKQQHLAQAYIEEREQTKKLLNVLASPDALTVKLAGNSEAPNASGVVKYNGRTGTVVCSANLPPLPAGKVYQLWLIPVNGAPISAGVFGMSDDGHGRMVTTEVPANTQVKAFAVTIESGGVAQPTGPKVLLGAS